MQICFVGQEDLLDYIQTLEEQNTNEKKRNDLIVFAFQNNDVCYERELKGETQYFESVAKLSKRNKNLVICGTITNTHGHMRKSAILAENGRILGVSDMVHAMDGEAHSGAFLRVYDTKIGRVGLVVAEDIYDVEVVKTLSLCGCDFIVCPFENVTDSVTSVLLRAYAFICGVPIFFCGRGYAMIADVDATLAFVSPISPISTDFSVRKEFHLLETRRKIYLKHQ